MSNFFLKPGMLIRKHTNMPFQYLSLPKKRGYYLILETEGSSVEETLIKENFGWKIKLLDEDGRIMVAFYPFDLDQSNFLQSFEVITP